MKLLFEFDIDKKKIVFFGNGFEISSPAETYEDIAEFAKDVIENELVKKTDAYKNGRIVYLNPITWYTVSGGYTSTLNMIEEVNKAIK